MKIEQRHWKPESGWDAPRGDLEDAHLVLLFAGREALRRPELLDELRRAHPTAHLLGCSTAGEIRDVGVWDDTAVATAVRLERSRVVLHEVPVATCTGSEDAGARLARAIDRDGLVHVLVLSDGLTVNGSELVRGLSAHLPADVTVTGGMAADGSRFEETLVVTDGPPRTDTIAALALYGSTLRVGYASLGGWDPFGPERLVTKAERNVLYEMDDRSALQLYKEYLGEHAADLPAAGVLFPLALRTEERRPLVRTVLAVDEERQSMVFAGDVPTGSWVQLMKANFDRLVDGAVGAARSSLEAFAADPPELAVLISCVGRKMVLKQRIEEEVEAVRDVLGPRPVLTGFYSYGEISPFTSNGRCELHNQTMTITAIAE